MCTYFSPFPKRGDREKHITPCQKTGGKGFENSGAVGKKGSTLRWVGYIFEAHGDLAKKTESPAALIFPFFSFALVQDFVWERISRGSQLKKEIQVKDKEILHKI